jgi:Dolichyl-phosphate-mannose-protein mannosyltransferase
MRVNIATAVFAGLALRIFFVLRFPTANSGDAPFYIELAWNWLKNGIYGTEIAGRVMPLDTRVPGYPAFLAVVFATSGTSPHAVMLWQVFLDLAACGVIALMAARLAPSRSEGRAALAALWLAVLCPFTANYTAAALTETLVTFLTALALLFLLEAFRKPPAGPPEPASARALLTNPWFLAGVTSGVGALVRPETPLLLAAAGLMLLLRWRHPAERQKTVRAALLMAIGLLLPLLPWAARNWRSLNEVQFLAPRYANLPGEFVPLGFQAWTRTWLWRYGDVYLTVWKLDDEPIPPDSIPERAFDSSAERARVEAVLEGYNNLLTLTPDEDRVFAELARERTERHRLRTWVEIPVLRSFAMWFTPRIELLPLSGHISPLRTQWQDDRKDLIVTLLLGFVNLAYMAMGLVGAWISRGRAGSAPLIAFVVLRTAFFALFTEAPEPRYVLECFPVVIAFAAQVFARPNQLSSTGSG